MSASLLFIFYENDILNDPKGFVEKTKKFLNLNQAQEDELNASVVNFDAGKARFNKVFR